MRSFSPSLAPSPEISAGRPDKWSQKITNCTVFSTIPDAGLPRKRSFLRRGLCRRPPSDLTPGELARDNAQRSVTGSREMGCFARLLHGHWEEASRKGAKAQRRKQFVVACNRSGACRPEQRKCRFHSRFAAWRLCVIFQSGPEIDSSEFPFIPRMRRDAAPTTSEDSFHETSVDHRCSLVSGRRHGCR